MMFDVVIGNPPYQSGKGERGGRTALWRTFTKHLFFYLRPNGVLSFVVPTFSNSSKDLGDIYTKYQTLYVNTDVSWAFPKQGTSAVYWAVRNTPNINPTYFIRENLYLRVTSKPLPNIICPLAISIIDKIENTPKLEIQYTK